METVLKETKSKSHKEFEKLLTEDLGSRKFKEGEIATGIVEEIGKKFVFSIRICSLCNPNFPHPTKIEGIFILIFYVFKY